jgi:hypothetical protein
MENRTRLLDRDTVQSTKTQQFKSPGPSLSSNAYPRIPLDTFTNNSLYAGINKTPAAKMANPYHMTGEIGKTEPILTYSKEKTSEELKKYGIFDIASKLPQENNIYRREEVQKKLQLHNTSDLKPTNKNMPIYKEYDKNRTLANTNPNTPNKYCLRSITPPAAIGKNIEDLNHEERKRLKSALKHTATTPLLTTHTSKMLDRSMNVRWADDLKKSMEKMRIMDKSLVTESNKFNEGSIETKQKEIKLNLLSSERQQDRIDKKNESYKHGLLKAEDEKMSLDFKIS